MKQITVQVEKRIVYNEVAKMTSYIGARGGDPETMYERVFATDEDRVMLERFWVEACSNIVSEFRSIATSSSFQQSSQHLHLGNNFEITLSLSDRFSDTNIKPVTSDLCNFFVNYILGKWLGVTSGDAEGALSAADENKKSIKKLLFQKERPTR